ncbi:hypothetical protein ABFX02_08G069000 [Erythranthe guttata]
MERKIDQRILQLILASLVVLLVIQPCLCQNDQQYETCRQPFRCGSMNTELAYPFWGGDRPPACGYPGFELNCGGDGPLLSMPPLLYRVFDFNNSTQTVRVSRGDLWNNICPQFLFNTTLNFSLFDFYSAADDQNITLYYGCGLNQSLLTPSTFPNQFNCDVNGTNSWSLFFTREASGLGDGATCSNSISVPVNQNAARDLGVVATTSTTLLQSALASGFSIRWSAENDNCDECARSGGACGYNQDAASFACYCRDGHRNSSCSNDTTPPGGGNGSNRALSNLHKYIIIGVSLGTGIVILSIIIFFYTTKQRKMQKLNQESNQNVDKFLLTHGSLAPKRYSYKQIKKITKSFTDKLGQGGFGTVYKGKLPENGQLVAVKILTKTSDDNTEDFINEVASISRTSHVNIVNLLGFCYDGKNRALVYEFMHNKSLDKFIHKNGLVDPDRSLGWEKMYEIAVGVARGLEYLHRGCNTRIVHFDIKPQNILLDEEFCPKISDFGLAKLFKKKQSVLESMLGARGTIGYIAPEVFSRNFGAVSHKSDVYSYGMMILEMGGERKFDEVEEVKSSDDYFHDKIYKGVIIKNEGLDDIVREEEEEEISARKMLLVGIWCVQTAPSDRPSMTKVVEMLEGNLQSIPIPPKPFFSSPKLTKSQVSSSFSIDVVEMENSIVV